MKPVLAFGLLLASMPLVAEQAASDGPMAGGQGPDSLISLLSLGAGLVAVIALIFGCAWLVKRMNGLTGINSQAMRIVSVLSVGARERIVLVDVGGTQILLGITPSAIRTLHVFDEPVVTESGRVEGDFAKRLQAMIGRNWGDRSAADRGDRGGDA
ncbi:flagellar biosynthetic protein FliO [Marinobacter fonticola]|uniref:flagellar biosynthetic protein FliO n=1 Tax=Marinobacter fonticola TaxID=2603215 RepID=UPI0011E71325|nr:flagellar biosynthetic protein FliO [Marinobacter fonticola]